MKNYCECCHKEYLKFGTQRLCCSCAIYHKDLIGKISRYKREINRLRKIIYGQKRGSERIR